MEILDIIGFAKNHGILDASTPSGLRVDYHSHSTGRHLNIYLTDAGVDDLCVYYTTQWFHSRYDFNERGKIHGMQPKCEFAEPIVRKFFSDLTEKVHERQCNDRMSRIKENMTLAAKENATINHYKNRHTN